VPEDTGKEWQKTSAICPFEKTCSQSDLAVRIWRTAMKLLKILTIAGLLFVAASTLSAQNSLADPNDNACWQSLDALHACAQVQNDRALAQAERCTSYPEYQCEPEPQSAQNAHVAKLRKQKSKVTSAQSQQTSGDSAGSEAVVVNLNPAN
jgi:hypothetical protein